MLNIINPEFQSCFDRTFQITFGRSDCQGVQDLKSSGLLWDCPAPLLAETMGVCMLVNFSGVKFKKLHKAQGSFPHHLHSTGIILVFSMQSALWMFFFGFPSSWVTTWRTSLLRWWRGFHRFLHSHQEPMRSTVKIFREAPINIGPKPPHLGDFLPLPAYHKHHALVALILTVTQMDISCLLLSLLTSFTFSPCFLPGFLMNLALLSPMEEPKHTKPIFPPCQEKQTQPNSSSMKNHNLPSHGGTGSVLGFIWM